MRRCLLALTILLLPASIALAEKGKPKAPATDGAFPLIESQGHSLHGAPWQPVETLSFSTLHGIDAIPAPAFDLPMEDHDFYLLQDEATGSGTHHTALRIGVAQSVNMSVEHGEWIDVNGGSLWRIEVSSPNALSSRLQLTGINLPAGQELMITAPGVAESTVGPIEGVGEFGNGTAWGICTGSNRTMIEWFVPHGQRVKGLPFTGVNYEHGYRDIFRALDAGGDGGVAAGCSNDPICFAAWANESNAACKLVFTSGGGSFLCSGQLMATTAADETPYVSTANHCISTTAEANSCQFIFFFRRTVCGAGIVQAGSSVTGSDLTGTYLASDCTLLMARPILPTTVFWAGWTNATVPTGTASTGIHYPSGTEQAISFGTKNAASFNCGTPTTNWTSMSWSNGITEGGSSGSAIYRTSDHRMYGVLTCGSSACTNLGGTDGYGRWDLAVNNGGFAAFLAAGTDDAQEQNDTCATARAVSAGTALPGLIVKRLDEDWYSLSVAVGSTMTVSSTYTTANGDVDFEVYSACATTPVLQRLANVSNESFTFLNNTASNTLLLRVFLGGGTRNIYSLTYSVVTPPPNNDDCLSAQAVLVGNYPFNTAGATNGTLAVAASCTDGAGATLNKDVWYRFIPECNGTSTISTCGLAAFDTRIIVYASGLSCPTAASTVIACNDNGVGCTALTSTVSFTSTDIGQYYVRIGSKAVVGGAGTVSFSCTPSAPPCPSDIDQSGAVDAGDLAALLNAWGPCTGCAADLDASGAVDAADLALILNAWGACP